MPKVVRKKENVPSLILNLQSNRCCHVAFTWRWCNCKLTLSSCGITIFCAPEMANHKKQTIQMERISLLIFHQCPFHPSFIYVHLPLKPCLSGMGFNTAVRDPWESTRSDWLWHDGSGRANIRRLAQPASLLTCEKYSMLGSHARMGKWQ
jgi:hypothetical protein